MTINYNSFYSDTSLGGRDPVANKTVKWLPMDTEELYKKNLINQYDKLKKYNSLFLIITLQLLLLLFPNE